MAEEHMDTSSGTPDDARHRTPRMSGVYRHPFGGVEAEDPLPVHERNMHALSASIRAKPNWWTKIFDATIRAKWKEEAIGAPVPYGRIPLSNVEVDYVLDEVQWHAARRDAHTGIEPSMFYRIWQSDVLVDEALRADLLAGVARLEDVPADQKDWHPRSDGQVLDLVHPSLYCVVYGRTLARHAQDVAAIPVPPDRRGKRAPRGRGLHQHFVSEQFSWLPTDFVVTTDGKGVQAQGYINNLCPDTHVALYPVIEQLVARFIPLWERVLAESRAENTLPLRTRGGYEWIVPRKPRPGMPTGITDGRSDDNADDEDECYSDAESVPEWDPVYGWDEHKNHILRLHLLALPFKGHPEPEPVDLKGSTIQIIVKLANIHLTPEKPCYAGGSWHVEGMMNEAIVSTGIYYYDEENITQSSLAFRRAVGPPCTDSGDTRGAIEVFGIPDQEHLNQLLGAVDTHQGRCIAFPNLYQHQVQPFELRDKSKPGHRKMLVFFLVDPALKKRRPSTSDVPPQQQEWIRSTLIQVAENLRGCSAGGKGLGMLPAELLDMIIDEACWLMTKEEAESTRLQLMDERTGMVTVNNERVFCAQFNLCEH